MSPSEARAPSRVAFGTFTGVLDEGGVRHRLALTNRTPSDARGSSTRRISTPGGWMRHAVAPPGETEGR